LVAAALAHAARLALWRPRRSRTEPLVWALHVAYAWIPVHLALRAAGALGAVPGSAATHALAVGAIGGLVIAMITRTARGHTGRALRADRFDVACYALVLGAAALRVLVPLLAPALLVASVLASAALWSAGFALYALRYAPMLARARPDGRPG
nr:NnrS family protein [Burkholderiaceae bacterium]